MKFRRFEPLGRDLSTLVLGTAIFEHATFEDAVGLLDAWIELGGNTLDTGRQYGNAESIVGRWLAERANHRDVVVITKAGHYDEATLRPRITTPDLASDVSDSRHALGLKTIDLLLLHRDDPKRPAPEILEDLRPLRDSGDVRALGASNWTIDRLDTAARYARTYDVPSFSCSSPNLSLAVASGPLWPGCVSISRERDHTWYLRNQLPVFSWQALAGGFFAGMDDPDIRRVYGSKENLERLRRARHIAQKLGGTPSQVALAWALAQPYPVYAIVGPRATSELQDCVDALDLELSEQELRWLDLQDDPPPYPVQ